MTKARHELASSDGYAVPGTTLQGRIISLKQKHHGMDIYLEKEILHTWPKRGF